MTGMGRRPEWNSVNGGEWWKVCEMVMVIIRVNIQLNARIVKLLSFVSLRINSHSLKCTLSPLTSLLRAPTLPLSQQLASKTLRCSFRAVIQVWNDLWVALSYWLLIFFTSHLVITLDIIQAIIPFWTTQQRHIWLVSGFECWEMLERCLLLKTLIIVASDRTLDS